MRIPHFTGIGLLLALALGTAPGQAGTEDLRQSVEQAAAEQAPLAVEPPDRFEVLSARWTGPVPQSAGPLSWRWIESTGPNQAGLIQVRFLLLERETPLGEARVSVRGRRLGPALVSRGTLPAGRPVTADHVALAEVDLTRLLDAPLRDPADLRGRVPRRTLGGGQPLGVGGFEPAPVVFRGRDVRLVYRTGLLEVVTRGTALLDGAPGEPAAARNAQSGARVTGRALADGRILVSAGGTP